MHIHVILGDTKLLLFHLKPREFVPVGTKGSMNLIKEISTMRESDQ
jgi:hypothetical protein